MFTAFVQLGDFPPHPRSGIYFLVKIRGRPHVSIQAHCHRTMAERTQQELLRHTTGGLKNVEVEDEDETPPDAVSAELQAVHGP